MSVANQELANKICEAMREAMLFTAEVSGKFEKLVLAGKVKPEDWQSAIGESLPVGTFGDQRGD
jgi:hypothetical protein